MSNSLKERQLRIHTQWLIATTSVALPMGWATGDPISLTEENGRILIKNLTDPAIIVGRKNTLHTKRLKKLSLASQKRAEKLEKHRVTRASKIMASTKGMAAKEDAHNTNTDEDGFIVLGVELDHNAQNMVYSFSEVLEDIREGKLVTKHDLPKSVRRRMFEDGIIISGSGLSFTALSSEANKVLNKILSDPNKSIHRTAADGEPNLEGI